MFVSKLIFPRKRSADGFIIVAVLWILAALATLASVYALYVSNTAVAAHLVGDRLRAEALVSAAVELTAYRLVAFEENLRPTFGAFAFRLGRSDVTVEFRSEGARIDLNEAPKEFLTGLFATLGAKPENAQYYAERIVGWRKKADAAGQNKEADAYRDAGLSYAPRQAPFQNVAELRLVMGLPPTLVERALPFMTVFNGRAEIDVIGAAPEVVAALPNMTGDLLAKILEQRDPRRPQAVLGLLGAARSSVAIEGRKATRVAIRIAFDDGRRVNADVVVLILESGAEPYRILSWRDDFDGPI